MRGVHGAGRGHHSWYKHLPLVAPGEPFLLYLHPFAHRVLVERADAAAGVWRPFVRAEDRRPGWRTYAVELQPGDVMDDVPPSLVTRYAEGLTTVEYRQRYSSWVYWNHGRPGQPVDKVLAAAAARLRVHDEEGRALPVTPAVLAASLVYLRGTLSPFLGPSRDEYEALRAAGDLPSHAEEREDQLRALELAMQRVAEVVYR